MPKNSNFQTPGEVLQKYIDDYQTNPFALSKSLKVAYQSVTHIIQGKSRISVPMALRLAQYFGNSPQFWLDVQYSSEINELCADKKFTKDIQNIPRAQKSAKKSTVKSEEKNPKAGSKKKKRTVKNPAIPKKTAKVKSRRKVKAFKTERKTL